MKKRAILLTAMLLGPVLALAAGSWWNNDWKFRKEIGFDLSPTGADIAATTSDVPVLIRFSLANFSYFNDTKPDGSDFRVIAGDDKTPLKFHFEKYDPQNQMALLWIRVPQITGASKTEKVFAYYGNPDAPTAADVPGTYDAQQALVLSFSDGAAPSDLTAYKNNPSASTAELTPAGLIGGGAKFAGKQSITVPATASLRLLPNQGLTTSAWVKVEAAQQATVMSLSDQGKEVTLDIEGSKFVAHANFGGSAAATVAQTADFALSAWHHVALSIGGGKLTLFVDGNAAGSAPVTPVEIGGTFNIGAANGAKFLTGEVDEVEVSKIARTAEWIKAAARGQGIDANLVIYGADGQKEGGGQGSYFGTIAKNLTLDGWVVIGICMMMLFVALLIMIVKAFFLSKVEKANTAFLKEFRKLSGDAAALDDSADADSDDLDDAPTMAALTADDTKYGASTLYRLYHHGVRELNKRVGGKAAGADHVQSQALSHQSIDAIRAAMDATMTRLQQSLSSQMVLLTIAISGGPFLGLLGTVIGVMITFAAIAQAGDVNVNAMRPARPPRWPRPSPACPSRSRLCSDTTGSTRESNRSAPTTGYSSMNSSPASPNSTARSIDHVGLN